MDGGELSREIDLVARIVIIICGIKLFPCNCVMPPLQVPASAVVYSMVNRDSSMGLGFSLHASHQSVE